MLVKSSSATEAERCAAYPCANLKCGTGGVVVYDGATGVCGCRDLTEDGCPGGVSDKGVSCVTADPVGETCTDMYYLCRKVSGSQFCAVVNTVDEGASKCDYYPCRGLTCPAGYPVKVYHDDIGDCRCHAEDRNKCPIMDSTAIGTCEEWTRVPGNCGWFNCDGTDTRYCMMLRYGMLVEPLACERFPCAAMTCPLGWSKVYDGKSKQCRCYIGSQCPIGRYTVL